MKDQAYLKGLNDLHDLLIDSRKGYKEAAERAEDPAVKSMLSTFSMNREPLISKLTAERKRMDATYEPSNGTLKGDVHRAWMDVRDALSSTDNANVLKECERGEKFLIERYDEVMQDKELPEATRQLLRAQQDQVRENLETVRSRRQTKDAIE